MADYLPLHLITLILCRLPVKSLSRFRCVSNRWRNLINTPDFIKLHLQHTNNQTLLITSSTSSYYSVDFPALKQAIEINHPLKHESNPTEFWGTCNGLVLLHNDDNKEEECMREETILYNPMTRTHRVLPFEALDEPDFEGIIYLERFVFGFGYDEVADDYKVVRVVQIDGPTPDFYDSEVKVYSSKANAWKRSKDFPGKYLLSYRAAKGEFVGGCLHWVVTPLVESCEAKLIIAFDVRTENYKFVDQPKKVGSLVHVNLVVLKGCLCVMYNYPGFLVEVWVMEEYGEKGSWKMLFTVEQGGGIGYFDYVRPVTLSLDGGKVLLEQESKKLLWYDVRRKSVKKVGIRGVPSKFLSEMLVESLVSLDCSKKKRRKKPKKKRNQQSAEVSDQFTMLPPPLLCDIFVRLPTDTLLEFKRVCKTWNKVIDAPDFAKMHLEVYVQKNDDLNFILREEKLYLVDYNRLDEAVQINHPLTTSEGWTDVLGSCNGLVFLYNEKKDLAVWNPLTGRCHKIPFTEFQCPKGFFANFVHGFGYDPIGDDYKVVQVLQLYNYQSQNYLGGEFSDSDDESDGLAFSEVQVYSLKNKCWRTIADFPYILCYTCPGILANEALYWVARRRGDSDSLPQIVIAFDLGSEKFREVAQPDYGNVHFHMSLWLLAGSLCILCHYPKYCVDVWVMKDSKLQSWSKLFSVAQPKPIKSFEYIKPLAYSKNGSEVLLELDYSKFIWYNLKKKSIRHVNTRGLPNSFGTEVFPKSLIDPCNVSGVRERDVMQSGHPRVSLAAFPKKLLCQILSWLPARTLVQVKCVCKVWYSVISDPEFVKAHLELSTKHATSLSLFVGAEKLLFVNFQQLDKASVINHPLFPSEVSIKIVGSANGLVCLYKSDHMALWNPETGDYEILPGPTFQLKASEAIYQSMVYGFGYDPIADDYKVVSILQVHKSLRGGSIYSEVQTYSLRAKSWGKTCHFPYVVFPCSGVHASGALHWVSRQNPELYSSSNLLLAFDLGAEKCKEVTQPNYTDTDFHMSLGLLRGCLCLLCHYPRQSVDFWIMTDPVSETWMKLVCISQPEIIKRFDYLKPLAYSEDGTEILLEQDNKKLLWYNMKKKTVKYVNTKGLLESFEAVICSGSLVPLGNATTKYVENREQAPNRPQTRKNTQRDNLDGFLAKGFKLKL